MKELYLNPSCGLAGDMLTAALLDLGADTPDFWEPLRRLALPASTWSVEQETVQRHGITARRFRVDWDDEAHSHGRHLSQIKKIIDGSELPASVQAMAVDAFERLAAAEARVHGTTPEKVHFHEVGAVDAIADICGTCLALHILDVDHVTCAPIAVGSGSVHCAHGEMPVPVPAVVELLRDVPVVGGPVAAELTTPTGAALVRTMTEQFGPMPEGTLMQSGYGAGTRDFDTVANVLQVLLLDTAESASGGDSVSVIECNLDDITGERLSYVIAELLAAGALDVVVLPCTMKKGRPGYLLQLLACPADENRLADLVLTESTSFGVRMYSCRRRVLDREILTVDTVYGPIRVKSGRHPGTKEEIQISPEYDDCAAAAREHGVPLHRVFAAAQQAYS